MNLKIKGAMSDTVRATMAYFKKSINGCALIDSEFAIKDSIRDIPKTVTSPTLALMVLVRRLTAIEMLTCLDSRRTPRENPSKVPQVRAEFPRVVSG